MYRSSCPNCGEKIFTEDLNFKCNDCKHEFIGTIDSLRIEANVLKRKTPKSSIKNKILMEQDHSCYWCSREFGTVYFRYNKISSLSPNWDHIIPYSYSLSNADDNFVASCSICNGFKSSHMFDSDRRCRAYIKKRWIKHLRSGKIVLLEGDMENFEENCKKLETI